MPRSIGWILFTIVLAGSGLACSNGVSTPTSLVVPGNATVSTIAVTGGTPTVGTQLQFTAVANMSDSTTRDVTAVATWQTTNNAVATVSATGVVTAVAPGTVSVTATYQNVTGSLQITITS